MNEEQTQCVDQDLLREALLLQNLVVEEELKVELDVIISFRSVREI